MIYLTEADVRQLLPMQECVRVMREMFQSLRAGEAINQVRRRMFLPSGSVLHSMGGATGNYFGTKFYSANVKHGAHFFFMLFDEATAKPLAMMEANYLGQIRTGAASGYATDLLAPKAAKTLGVVGSGFQARSQIEAMLTVRPIASVKVFGRTEVRRQAFADECTQAFGIPVKAVASAQEAVVGADIVVTATFARDPVLDSAWIHDGVHINAMGSNQRQKRELPPELIARASRIVVDSIEQARMESGDLVLAWTDADWQTPRLSELKDVADYERSAKEVTIFKSHGIGVEDVAAGAYVYEKALAAGLGRPFYS